MSAEEPSLKTIQAPNTIQAPAPTAWPMVFALGLALVLAGMVTNVAIGILGLVLLLRAAFGWFSAVLPVPQVETFVVAGDAVFPEDAPETQNRAPAGERHRKILPIERFTPLTGIKGGIAGGFAMILPATVFSLIRYGSVWYAMNLLAAGGFVSWAGASDAFLSEFHLKGFLAALAIHAATSLLVGSLYGAMLPMFPRFPILTAGFIAPFLWTGLLYTTLGIISPILDRRIDWGWFILSQIAFGLAAGYVVNLQVKVRTPQFRALPFSVRAGIASDRGERSSPNESARNEKKAE